jgi:hypothetical protein
MAQIKLKTAEKATFQVGPNLRLSKKAHTNLLAHIKGRLDFAHKMRSDQIDRYTRIDKEVAGFIILDDADKKRKLDNDKGMGPKIYDTNLPLAAVQMDEAVTYFTTVFFPEEGPYNAVTDAEKQPIAKGFSSLMNLQSSYYKHFTNFAKGAYDGLKYNLGLWHVEWKETKGSLLKNAEEGGGALQVLNNQTVMMGNKYGYLDPYNTLLDPSVHPSELHADGEFFAIVEAITLEKAKRMQAAGEIHNLKYLEQTNGLSLTSSDFSTRYYEIKPEIHGDSSSASGDNETDWVSFLSGNSNQAKTLRALEHITVHIRLVPKQWELGPEKEYQIWRLTIEDSNLISSAEHMTNAHGWLPLLATVPWDDGFNIRAKSYAEMLLPYQRFASFQINIHQRAARKALYRLTVYNSRYLSQMKDADVLGGKVPMDPTAEDIDIRKLIAQFGDTPDTQNTLADVDSMDSLMQKILPTDILRQVAGLERATQYQAAATVQGANRRNLKIAKTIDTQAFGPGRRMQMYNILQFQESMEILSPEGELVQIEPFKLREQQFEFTISDGLRGMDKLILVETMKDVLNVLVQNPQAAQEFNIAEIVNYITTLIGDHTSFAQFKFKNDFDRLNPEQKQQAFQLLQAALQQQAAEGAPTPGAA